MQWPSATSNRYWKNAIQCKPIQPNTMQWPSATDTEFLRLICAAPPLLVVQHKLPLIGHPHQGGWQGSSRRICPWFPSRRSLTLVNAIQCNPMQTNTTQYKCNGHLPHFGCCGCFCHLPPVWTLGLTTTNLPNPSLLGVSTSGFCQVDGRGRPKLHEQVATGMACCLLFCSLICFIRVPLVPF